VRVVVDDLQLTPHDGHVERAAAGGDGVAARPRNTVPVS
jgi:hypothetical protein